jgi:hypothetical protein
VTLEDCKVVSEIIGIFAALIGFAWCSHLGMRYFLRGTRQLARGLRSSEAEALNLKTLASGENLTLGTRSKNAIAGIVRTQARSLCA